MKKLPCFALALPVLLMAACATPANIVYFQDSDNGETFIPAEVRPICLKPMDQVSIIVNSRDPQVTAMFNLPYYTYRIGEAQSVTSLAGSSSSFTASNSISGYTVDSEGYIDFPVIGKVKVAGLTREQTAEHIKGTARYAGPNHDHNANMEKLLSELEMLTLSEAKSASADRPAPGLCASKVGKGFMAAGGSGDMPPYSRRARFHTVVTLILADGQPHFFEGFCEGAIATRKAGCGGFGYDPVFLPDAYPGRTLAEVSEEEKNAVSHRGSALRAMADWLKTRFAGH